MLTDRQSEEEMMLQDQGQQQNQMQQQPNTQEAQDGSTSPRSGSTQQANEEMMMQQQMKKKAVIDGEFMKQQSAQDQMQQNQLIQEETAPAIGEKEIAEAAVRMKKYKAGKAMLENKIIESEQYWKQRHWQSKDTKDDIAPTAWLWNVILSKHADLMDGFPSANAKPKEAADVSEAKKLSSIIPVVLEENGFKKTYSSCMWYKLIKGTAVYGVFWDGSKNNNLGDISIKKIDLLNLFWEPGISDIQNSKEVFHAVLINNEIIEGSYPHAKDKLGVNGANSSVSEYAYDDTVDTSEKSLVIDWYYKKMQDGKVVLHYCKFVNNIVLFASENEISVPTAVEVNKVTGQQYQVPNGESMSSTGFYKHGKYPFVFDPLFVVEGSPCGYSYTDICKAAQDDIDILNHAIVKNALISAKSRYFIRSDAEINEEEFTNIENDLVHVNGNLSTENVRPIDPPNPPSIAMSMLAQKVDELKETSGNRDVNNGSSSSGVTAASAIAALQEASGKTSRDMLACTYEAFKDVTYLVIELIREFYDVERQFRIVGDAGREEFTGYSNQNLQPQGFSIGGDDLGLRVPCFDIEVSAEKNSAYSKMAQNEFALQLYSAGFFNAQNAEPAVACLGIMDFAHKDDVTDVIRQNSAMLQQFNSVVQIAMSLAQQFSGEAYMQLAQILGMQTNSQQSAPTAEVKLSEQNADGTVSESENTRVANARKQSQESTQL